MYNRIYGVLSLNKSQEGDDGYHYSDVRCSKKQAALLSSLYKSVDKKDIGKIVCCLIELMRSSENWSQFIVDNDPNNTYSLSDNKTIKLEDSPNFSFATLKNWALLEPLTIGEYPYDPHETTMTNIINKLFSVVLLK